MNRVVIPFTTEEAWLKERTKWLTSSDIPCLFNVGYQSYDELLRNKQNFLSPNVQESEEMSWGNAIQQGIAEKFAKDNGWDLRRKDEFITIPELRLARSFDYEISYETEDSKGEAYLARELLEIKNVNEWKYKKDWKVGFEIEATPYIEIQIQNELLVSGFEIGYIGALIGGCKGVILRREANKKVQDAILLKVEKFWKDVDASK